MEQLRTILIADRNRNVRELLKREMCAEGYHVSTAANAAQVLDAVSGEKPPDIVVLDLDLPDAGGPGIIEELKSRAPYVPVVVHTLLSESIELPPVSGTVGFIEKQGDSVEELKRTVRDFLGGIPTVSAKGTGGYPFHPDR